MAALPMFPCPHCDRSFRQPNDTLNHIKAKHGGKGSRKFRDEHMPAREQSVGLELADALLAASMGEDVPEHIAMMFPDEIADARRRAREASR